jgi:hypothetical protein
MNSGVQALDGWGMAMFAGLPSWAPALAERRSA